MYIYDRPQWPQFTWDKKQIEPLLADIKFEQGRLLGKMESLGFSLREEAALKTLTEDVIKTSEIEGEKLNAEQVRSSIAKHLKIDIGGLINTDRHVDGIVEVMLDATQYFNTALTKKRLCHWHILLFPTARSGMAIINRGMWRINTEEPMQVVSGSYGREKVHFEAPNAERLADEMKKFIAWFNKSQSIDLIIKSAIAHLWFVTLHPFDDGNGRIARAIADMVLARSENQRERFYSMSSQIRIERKTYYENLERTQKGKLDITNWVTWFLECLGRAIKNSESVLETILNKAKF